MDKITAVTGYKDIASLKQAADHIIEVNASITYLGFCKAKTVELTEAKWAILEIKESNHGAYPNQISFKWANGNAAFINQLSEYASYEYSYHTF